MAQPAPNILVVEDDRETRNLIAKYLRTNACNVRTAADGREMVRAMTDRRIDLLILDVMLPGEDGLSLCRKVRGGIAGSDHHADRARRGRRPHHRP
jgi:two-component system OmpR family response regulator